MSNTTARQDIIARIAGEIDDAFRLVVALDCADLAALAASDQAAAAAQLAYLTGPQLVTQAQAYASYLNAKYCDDVTGEQVLAIFQRCIAKHTPEPSAPADEAAAEHNDTETSTEPTSMTSITFSSDASISTSEPNGPTEPEIPVAIRTFDLDPMLTTGLRLVLEAQHAKPAYSRALSKAISLLTETRIPFIFDGCTLTIASNSTPGAMQSTDGDGCTCKGASHAICWHRAAFDLLFLAEALTDRAGLRRALLAA